MSSYIKKSYKGKQDLNLELPSKPAKFNFKTELQSLSFRFNIHVTSSCFIYLFEIECTPVL